MRSWSFALVLVVVLLLGACNGDGVAPPLDGGDDGGVDATVLCTTAAQCSDVIYCNGAERCAPGTADADERGCVSGTPVECSPGETCDERASACRACSGVDADGDGTSQCDGDCDDADPSRYPGATEVCDGDDEDCNEATFGFLDTDGDGYSSDACCNGAGASIVCGTDCDPERPGVHPDATETCDGRDNDCDGEIDEGVTRTFHLDADGDGFGDPGSVVAVGCVPTAGYVEDSTDCDDAQAGRNPGAPEVCDGVDNDCDGTTDEFVSHTYYRDQDHDGYGLASATTDACSRPADYADRAGDCDDGAAARSPALPEVCDGVDNDCDGVIDNSAMVTNWYRDADGDGHGSASDSVASCAAVAGRVLLAGDCDDTNPSRNPAAPEVCDGVDNDCDALVDEGVALSYYRDVDGDGFGVTTDVLTACARPAGYSPLAGDCDDTASRRSPALPEFCDGIDNDCDGVVDNGVAVPIWYQDSDADGYGRATATVEACVRPTGYRDIAGDCDDGSPSRNPAAPEVCDGVDNDCDLVVDDGVLQTFYRDADLDGYGTVAIGAPGAILRACAQPAGYASAATDCDDSRPSRNPGAPEVCDGVDNDCNGLLDYPGEDPDRDGHTIPACGGDDCDNTRADVYPGAPELCDGRDNDCNGVLGTAEDADRDGRASIACGGGDCDDTNPTVFAGATERCDGLDNNCNGAFDGPGEDVDGDRYVSIGCGGADCNDNDPTIHPGVAERCDAVDDNCDGVLMVGEDDDGDHYADVACGGTDCDDSHSNVHPGADEGCDGLDSDCGGGLGGAEDADRDGYARASCGAACVGACGDCDDARSEAHPGAAELCDGRDDDCDGVLGALVEDVDRDGHATTACGAACTGVCDDCDDTRATTYPGSPVPADCNGLDDDCNGIADDMRSTFSVSVGGMGVWYGTGSTAWTGTQQISAIVDTHRGSRDLAFTVHAIDGHKVQDLRYLTSELSDEYNPSVAWAGGSFVVTYLDNRSGTPQTYFLRAALDGTVLAGPVALSSGVASPARPYIAVDPTGTYALVTWDQDDLDVAEVVRVATGVVVGTLPALASTGGAGGAPIRPRWDPATGTFALIFQAPRGTLKIARVATTGALALAPVVLIPTGGPDQYDLRPLDGHYVVVWPKGSGLGLRAQFVTTDGVAIGTATAISAGIGNPDGEVRAVVTPAYVWVFWSGAMTARRRSDLGPVAGAYPGGFYINPPDDAPFASGHAMTVFYDSSENSYVINAACY